MRKIHDDLTIREEAEYYGVAANTLRNWGRDVKISKRRLPDRVVAIVQPM